MFKIKWIILKLEIKCQKVICIFWFKNGSFCSSNPIFLYIFHWFSLHWSNTGKKCMNEQMQNGWEKFDAIWNIASKWEFNNFFVHKVQSFYEGHKSLKKSPSQFDVYFINFKSTKISSNCCNLRFMWLFLQHLKRWSKQKLLWQLHDQKTHSLCELTIWSW